MATMYEIIMDLPLFKGVGKDHVSSFLEKTNVNFVNFGPGDRIIERGDNVPVVRFVISGQVSVSHILGWDGSETGDCVTLVELAGNGRVFGVDRLYGLSMTYPYEVKAETAVSVMEFSKAQYQRLVSADPIYLLNFVNYLSRRAQIPVDALTNFKRSGAGEMLRYCVSVLTDPSCICLQIKGTPAQIAGFTGEPEKRLAHWLADCERDGVLEYSNGVITIASRGAFLSRND